MKFSHILLVLPLLASCTPVSDKTPGTVISAGGGEVLILARKKHGEIAAPTQRMIEQAEEICPGAIFQSAQPSLHDNSMFEYRFKC